MCVTQLPVCTAAVAAQEWPLATVGDTGVMILNLIFSISTMSKSPIKHACVKRVCVLNVLSRVRQSSARAQPEPDSH